MSSVRHLESSAQVPVDGALAGALARLAHGVDDDVADDGADDELYSYLSLEGVAVANAPSVDPLVEARLSALGAGFGWLVDEDPRGRALTALLRRAHARRKVFFPEYGQTPVIPEIAAYRCLEIARELPQGARVLHVGDDDMLSLGMASLGFSPFIVDIDPLLLSFLDRVAKEEGLVVESRVQDLLAPFPTELCGAFDAAFSDPMSFEDCQVAFLSRACAALKQGGLLWTTVHPLAREVCERVYARLPVRRVRAYASKNVYYWLKFDESPYRSDLVLLERVAGEAPWAPADQIPFEHIVTGELSERTHGALEVRGVRSKAKGPLSEGELASTLARGLDVPILGSFETASERYAHALVWFEGGQVAASFDQARGSAQISLYPFEQERSTAIHDAMAGLLRPLVRQAVVVPAFRMPPLSLSRSADEG